MTASHKQFEKWAWPHLRALQKLLLLEDYYPLELEFKPNAPNINAECQFYYPYKTITIRYSNSLVNNWRKKKYRSVLATLAHEMAHVVTDPLYAKACNMWRSKDELEDERERLTDHLANIVMKNNLL